MSINYNEGFNLNQRTKKGWEPEKKKYSLKTVWSSNIGMFVLTMFVLYFVSPKEVHDQVFDGLILNGKYILPWVLFSSVLGWAYRKSKTTIPSRRFIISSISGVLLVVALNVMTHGITDYVTFKMFVDFQRSGAMVQTDPRFVRYTGMQNAFADMNHAIKASTEEVTMENTVPFVTDTGFGYVAPITPDGFIATFDQKNPGFVVYDDRAISNPKVRRVVQPFTVGQGMQLLDNLERQLIYNDFFATYDHPHYVVLDPTKPEHFTAVVSKIKYKWFMFPYWGGVVLIHDNGKMEDLSAQAAMSDPRLQGQWLFPQKLAKEYVMLENYKVGWGIFSTLFRVPGRLEIPNLPGESQFPMLTHGADRVNYHVIATKAAGSGGGLYRMYYVNATTGKGTYYEYGVNEIVYGPEAALQRVTNEQSFNWYREEGDSKSGNMIPVEPVYIVRPEDGKLFWKISVTNLKYAGIAATVISPASNPNLLTLFKNQNEFDAWLNGGTIETVSGIVCPSQTSGISAEKLHEVIDALTTDLQKLKALDK